MGSRTDSTRQVLESIRFVGSSSGLVKTLRGFNKAHHSVPDAVNPATIGFLGKIAAGELAEEGERFFQSARSLLGYKRKDLALDVNATAAVLATRDFVFELEYGLNESAPHEYVLTRRLHSLKHPDFLGLPQCAELFERLFSQVVFTLRKGARVEAVIDAVEGLPPGQSDLRVDFPSDYASCTLTLPGVAAAVTFDGRELTVSFPQALDPRALWDAFLAIRQEFALTKDAVLAGLIQG